ncbi:hypothetical protein [Acidianus brierleyi]|nr:hypothetical protein [Acidianus brierleyi]
MINKPGIFMEVLMEEIEKSGLKIPKTIGIGLDITDAEHWDKNKILDLIK